MTYEFIKYVSLTENINAELVSTHIPQTKVDELKELSKDKKSSKYHDIMN
tara:strand:+ start:57 stop:206 length:150 start_codon:yes stop_codon:yes gene_type:complete